MPKLSIIVPIYFNEDNLRPLYRDIRDKIACAGDFTYELVLVDDGSGDGSYAVMEELAAEDPNVRIMRLSRNFGSHAATLCGLSHCTGDCAVLKSADMQEPTELLLDMYASWRRGNNVVLAAREGREESAGQTLFANAYYWMVRKLALKDMPPNGFDAFLVDRKVIEVLERMDERNSAITGQILWSGFTTDVVYYTRRAREIGKSRWTLKKKIRLVTDTLFSFSTLPIALVSLVGALSFFGALIWSLVVLVSRLMDRIPVSGFTTLIIFNLFSFGVTMVTLGLLGGYLWRAFEASRNRPAYIVERSNAAPDREEDRR